MSCISFNNVTLRKVANLLTKKWCHPLLRLISAFCLVLHVVGYNTAAQPRPRGYLLTDSIEVGRPFRFALSIRHRSETEVFFPDSNYNFAPFELLKHEYFDTETDQRGSLDSAVYTLVSFELAPVQPIRLPVWLIIGRDCTAVFSQPDSVALRTVLGKKSAATALQTDVSIVALPRQVNYPLVLLALVSVVLLGLGVYLLFGDAMKRQWRLYQLFRRNQEFNRTFTRLMRNVVGKDGLTNVEQAVILWKSYMQRLEKKPFLTFTSREIAENLPDQQLSEALQAIDGVIYGGVSSAKTTDSLEVLVQIASDAYRQQRGLLGTKK
jgi:hypothetical protein